MADKYVGDWGEGTPSNGNSGDSKALPYSTWNFGIDNVDDFGTVHIANGTYDEATTISEADHGGKDITIKGESREGVLLTRTSSSYVVIIPVATVSMVTLRFERLKMLRTGSSQWIFLNQGLCHIFIEDCELKSLNPCIANNAVTVGGETRDIYINNSTLMGGTHFIEIDDARDVVVTNCIIDEFEALNLAGAIVRFDANDCRNIIISDNLVIAESAGLVQMQSSGNQDSLDSIYLTNNTIEGNAGYIADIKFISGNTFIKGNNFTKTTTLSGKSAIQIGEETTSPGESLNQNPLTGSVVIQDNSIIYDSESTNNHGILIGLCGDDIDILISGNFVKSDDVGIVVKEATSQTNNCTISNNRVCGKNCIWISGNDGTAVLGNSVYAKNGHGIQIGDNQRDEGISENVKVYANIVHNVGTGRCIGIFDSTGDHGLFSDNNCLISTGSGNVGSFAGSDQLTLADLQTLWRNPTGFGGNPADFELNEGLSVELNPGFKDPDRGDFTVSNSLIPDSLGASTPGVGSGDSSRYSGGGRY